MMCMYTEMFHILNIVPNATSVIYGILFSSMHSMAVWSFPQNSSTIHCQLQQMNCGIDSDMGQNAMARTIAEAKTNGLV